MRMRRKIGYALGDMGISISYFAVGFYFMYYLTDFVKLDPFLAGLAFFVGKLWDGVNDPLMGVISDRTRSRYGRKRVYVLFGALPMALSFILLWTIPVGADQWLQFALAVIALTIYSTAYTVVVVPYMSLVPVMTNNYDERTQITGLRAILSTLASVLGGGAAMLLSSVTSDVVGLRTISVAFGLFTLVCLIVAAQSVKGVEREASGDKAIVRYTLRQYLSVLKVWNVDVLLVVKVLGAVATGCLSAALPYFATYVLRDQSKGSIGLAIYVTASALTIPLWNRLTHRYDKRRLLLIGNGLTALVLFAIGFGVQAGNLLPFYLGCLLLGVSMASYLLIPYSLVPDLVDYYEFQKGERHESIFFGMWITVHQLGIALAGLILGASLSAFGYRGDLAVQPDAAAFAVRLAFGGIPGAFFLLTALVLQRYGVTRAVFEKARDELRGRAERARRGLAAG